MKYSEEQLLEIGGNSNMTIDVIDTGTLPRPPETERHHGAGDGDNKGIECEGNLANAYGPAWPSLGDMIIA